LSLKRFQNIRIPAELRPDRLRTSVSRTVRNIRPAVNSRFSLVGAATVYHRNCVVATASGKFWVILEIQHGKGEISN